MITNDTVLTNGDCATSYNEVNAYTPENADFAFCDLCDGYTPHEVCETHDEFVCAFCHLANIEYGFHV